MCPPYTSHQPLAILHTAPTPMHLLRARLHCHIWTCLSNHVSHCLEEFSPQTSPSGISYPMVGVPSMCPPPPINLRQYSTLHPHPRTRSEPGCTATLGRARPSMFPIAWRNFHHKPALVASFILWFEYLLCAHHTHFPIFQLPGTHVDPLFCQPGPSQLAHHLTHPSVHLCTPLHTFTHPCTPLCFTFPGLVTLIRLSSDL